jgi:hypothetical protein
MMAGRPGQEKLLPRLAAEWRTLRSAIVQGTSPYSEGRVDLV